MLSETVGGPRADLAAGKPQFQLWAVRRLQRIFEAERFSRSSADTIDEGFAFRSAQAKAQQPFYPRVLW